VSRRIISERIGHSSEHSDSSREFQVSSETQVTVSFDPKKDDLKDIQVKAAGSVIAYVLSENDDNYRKAARKMGTTHSTISRIMKKFRSLEKPQNYQASEIKPQKYAVAA